MKSWLVQRGQFRMVQNKDIVGVDSLISFDYMGSAEFEFGALPKSLRRITGRLNEFQMFKVDEVITKECGMPMFIFCNKNHFNEAKECAIYLSKNKYGYKEWCDMSDFIEGKKIRNNFWWDIENDFMVCFGDSWAEKVELAINKLKERWDKEKSA